MLYSIKNVEDLQNWNDLVSLQNQVNEVRLQDKLGEQDYHEDAKKIFKLMTDAIKNTSENVTKTLTEKSINIIEAIEKLNEKISDFMIDKGMIAPYLASSSVNLLKPEKKSQLRLKKDLNSTKMNDFLITDGIPVTLVSNLLIFRDSNKSFKLDGDLLETMTNYEFNVSNSNPKDQKLIYEFVKEMNFNIKQTGRKSDRNRELIKLLESPAILVSGISNMIILPSDPEELCKRLRLFLQEIQAGNNSDLINKNIVAIVDKLLE